MEINNQIAQKIFNWRWYDHKTIDKERKTLAPPDWIPAELRRDYDLVPNYCGDIAEAFKVVEKMREKGFYFASDNRTGEFWVEFATEDYGLGGQAFDKSLPKSICLASLEAIAKAEEG